MIWSRCDCPGARSLHHNSGRGLYMREIQTWAIKSTDLRETRVENRGVEAFGNSVFRAFKSPQNLRRAQRGFFTRGTEDILKTSVKNILQRKTMEMMVIVDGAEATVPLQIQYSVSLMYQDWITLMCTCTLLELHK